MKTLHTCIKKVTEDLDGMRFNTAISALMVFINDAITWETKPVSVLREFLDFAPALRAASGGGIVGKVEHSTVSVHLRRWTPVNPSKSALRDWPKFDPALLVESEIEIPVQVNGKFRDVIKVPADADNATIEAAAKAAEKAQPFIAGKAIKKVIIVPKKMVNMIVA